MKERVRAAAAGLRDVLERRRGRARPRAVVLLYHRVAELPADPQQLAISASNFEQHLRLLADRHTILPLAQLIRAADDGSLPERAVAITFDDGYEDNLVAAKPLLEAADAPATVYVASGYVGAAREFWWDEVERLVLLGAARAGEADRRAAYDRVLRELRDSGADGIDAALAVLRREAGEPERGAPRPTHLPLSAEQLAQLADDGLVTIGAHTRRHPRLAAELPPAQNEEIAGSRRDLEEILGRPVTGFSYPFGVPQVDYRRRTVAIARAAGYAYAVANRPLALTAASPRFELPRLLIRNWDAGELERALAAVGG